MGNAQVIERIAAWQAAGLINAETADRLRDAEAAEPSTAPTRRLWRESGARSFFGPIPSIAELFAYLGSGFVLVAWHVLNLNSSAGTNLVEWLIPAGAFGGIGVGLERRSDRERRAAGVAFGVATVHAYGAAWQLLNADPSNAELGLTLSALVAVAVALGFRRLLPAVLTQLGMLGALAALGATSLQWLGGLLFPAVAVGPDVSWPPPAEPNALVKVLLQAGWWLAWALAFGLIGLWEARQATAPRDAVDAEDDSVGAERRASVTRFAAGLTAVAGIGTAISAGQFEASGDYERVLAAWLGDGAVLAVAVMLLALAVRRGATAYLYPAALGVIVAFSDFNGQYIIEQTGIGLALLVEGLMLIGVGVLAERLRRRLATGLTAAVPLELSPL